MSEKCCSGLGIDLGRLLFGHVAIIVVDRLENSETRDGDNSEDEFDSDRRKVITSIGKFGAYVAPATIVLIDAETAAAHRVCSPHPHPGRGRRRGFWRWYRRNCL